MSCSQASFIGGGRMDTHRPPCISIETPADVSDSGNMSNGLLQRARRVSAEAMGSVRRVSREVTGILWIMAVGPVACDAVAEVAASASAPVAPPVAPRAAPAFVKRKWRLGAAAALSEVLETEVSADDIVAKAEGASTVIKDREAGKTSMGGIVMVAAKDVLTRKKIEPKDVLAKGTPSARFGTAPCIRSLSPPDARAIARKGSDDGYHRVAPQHHRLPPPHELPLIPPTPPSPSAPPLRRRPREEGHLAPAKQLEVPLMPPSPPSTSAPPLRRGPRDERHSSQMVRRGGTSSGQSV